MVGLLPSGSAGQTGSSGVPRSGLTSWLTWGLCGSAVQGECAVMSFTHPIEPLPESEPEAPEPIGFDEPGSDEDVDTETDPHDDSSVDPKDYPETDPAE
jgi:hypothetical protein